MKKLFKLVYLIAMLFTKDGRDNYFYFRMSNDETIFSFGRIVIRFNYYLKEQIHINFIIAACDYKISELLGLTQFGNQIIFFNLYGIYQFFRFTPLACYNPIRMIWIFFERRRIEREIIETGETYDAICSDPMNGCPEDFAEDGDRKIRYLLSDLDHTKYFSYYKTDPFKERTIDLWYKYFIWNVHYPIIGHFMTWEDK